MQTAEIPLLLCSSKDPIAWRQGRPIGRSLLLAHAARVSRQLPEHRFALNLSEDRYLFTVALAAAAIRGQTTLLPTSRVAGAVDEAAEGYPNCYRLGDEHVAAWMGGDAADEPVGMPCIAAGHLVAIPFTSGTTGRSQPHPKRWGDLVLGGLLAERRFGFAARGPATIVATVPPQHMYGLETSVILPLVTSTGVHAGRPFFPEDVCAALASIPPPRVLITTPAHLRVCVKAGLRWPALFRVISATAPLSKALAAECEDVFATEVMEIFGFTETGSVASRRTVTEDIWTLYDGLTLDGERISGGHVPEPVRPSDILERVDSTRFALTGREQDLVNIAGKRMSLAYLNRVLNEVEGVKDGVFVLPDDEDGRARRLLALVVAPNASRERILAALAERIDPIFLPRPLLIVPELPRNETGKLRRDAVRALIKGLPAIAYY